MDKLRSFIAIELPRQIKISLGQFQSLLGKGHDNSVKWVTTNSIHLTLKFLGNINLDAIPEISKAIGNCVKGTSPLSLSIGELGAFPNTQSPRVSWVGLKGDTGVLLKLQKRLDQALSEIGFTPETREFSPHLTLGRVRDGARSYERTTLGEKISHAKPKSNRSFMVHNISLMKSELTQKGAIYTKLVSASLTGSLSK